MLVRGLPARQKGCSLRSDQNLPVAGASNASQAGVSAPCADVFQPFQLLMSVAQYLARQPLPSRQQGHVGSLLAHQMKVRIDPV